jgi:hypothetical protein
MSARPARHDRFHRTSDQSSTAGKFRDTVVRAVYSGDTDGEWPRLIPHTPILPTHEAEKFNGRSIRLPKAG